MNNRLLVIGLLGLAVSVICLTVGGVQVSRLVVGKDGDTLISRLAELGFGGERCPEDGVSDLSRSWSWDGGDRVEISLPANVHYHPGSGDQLVVRGNSAVLSHVTLRDGHLRLNCNLWSGGDRLDVTLPGREFRNFVLNGSTSLNLQDIDQRELNIRLAGSGEIEGNGKVDNLEVTIVGSGKARLGTLTAQDVRVTIAGSGDIEVAPHDDLHVNIAGAGKVVLKSEPQHIDSHFAGSGRIIHDVAPDADKAPTPSPAAPQTQKL